MPKYRSVAQTRRALREHGPKHHLVYNPTTGEEDSRHGLQSDAVSRMYDLNDATEGRPWRVAFSPVA